MNMTDVERKLRELHRDGERTRFSFEISPIGTESFTVQRITGGVVHVGCTLNSAEDALIECNDSIAHADMEAGYAKQMVKP